MREIGDLYNVVYILVNFGVQFNKFHLFYKWLSSYLVATYTGCLCCYIILWNLNHLGNTLHLASPSLTNAGLLIMYGKLLNAMSPLVKSICANLLLDMSTSDTHVFPF